MTTLTKPQRAALATVKAAQASRRAVLKGALALGAAGLLAPAVSRSALSSSGQLQFLGWAGYDFQPIFDAFEKDTGIKVVFNGMGSQDEILAAITAQPEGYDLSEPTVDRLKNWIDGGYVQPWDESKINLENIEPAFLSGFAGSMTKVEGQRYGVPNIWGTELLVLNTEEVEAEYGTASLADLFDEKHAGALTLRAHSGLAGIGLLLDHQGKLPHPFRESFEDEAKMVANYDLILAFALENRDKVAQFWTNENEAQGAFRTNGCVVGLNWDTSAIALQKEGLPIKALAPIEGALTWAQNYVLLKGSPNVEQAHAWAAWANRAEGNHAWAAAYGANPVAKGAVALMDDFSKQFFAETYPGDALEKLFWWPTQDSWFVSRRTEYADKFLAA